MSNSNRCRPFTLCTPDRGSIHRNVATRPVAKFVPWLAFITKTRRSQASCFERYCRICQLGVYSLLAAMIYTLLSTTDLARISSSEEYPLSWTFPNNSAEWIKYKVYEYLWGHQLFVTPGLKFGGDYLAYPGDPLRYHSHYIVNARDRQACLSPVDLVSMGRLAVNVKKMYVLAAPHHNGEVEAFSIQWAGF